MSLLVSSKAFQFDSKYDFLFTRRYHDGTYDHKGRKNIVFIMPTTPYRALGREMWATREKHCCKDRGMREGAAVGGDRYLWYPWCSRTVVLPARTCNPNAALVGFLCAGYHFSVLALTGLPPSRFPTLAAFSRSFCRRVPPNASNAT